MSELSIRYRPVTELAAYAKNARTHSAEQVAQIAASIEEFGWTNPILVDEEGGLLAGHGRVAAALLRGDEQVPTVTVAGLSQEQKRALVIADNRIAMNAGWDDALLAAEIGDLKASGFDLGLLGFADFEIAGLLDTTAGLVDPEETPPPPENPISRLGDVWVLGRHRIMCGDSTDADTVTALLAGVRPHLMVTDPPYGVEYDPAWRARAGTNSNDAKQGVVLNDDRSDWREAWALFPGDVAYCWHAGRHASSVQTSLEATGFEIRCQVIWAKDRFALSRGHYHWQHEPCWYAVRKSAAGSWQGDRKQSTLWSIPARDDGGHGHSTQKPVECMKRPIENNSSPGQAVYEPFSGSGTTIIAAEMTGRCCYAIELSPAYVDVAVRRWEEFTGEKAHRESDGAPFLAEPEAIAA